MQFIKSLYSNFTQLGVPVSLIFYCLTGYSFILFSHSDNSVIPYLINLFGFQKELVDMYRDTSKIFGQTIITSGVATTLLRTNFFSNILQKQLFKVVYTEQLLQNRKDISEIWSRVSKVLYLNKFPDIADHINETITKRYFPIKKHYYYFRVENSVKIKVLDKATKFIEMTETLTGTIKIHRNMIAYFMPNDESNIIPISGSIGLLDVSDIKTEVIVSEGKFNGSQIPPDFKFERVSRRYNYKICFDLRKISGDSIDYEYTVTKRLHMLQDIDFLNRTCDNIHFNYTLYVNYEPSEFDVWFTDLGTANDYLDVNKNAIIGQISKKYEGVMFPGQGYSLTLRIK